MRLTTFGVRRGVPLLFNVRDRPPPHPSLRARASCSRSAPAARRCSRATTSVRETLAIPLGVGMGLTFDESALLLELEDVYWTREGLVGVQITLGTASLLAAGDARPADPAPRRAQHGGAARAAAGRSRLRDRVAAGSALRSSSLSASPDAATRRGALAVASRSPGRGPGPTPTSLTGTPTNSATNSR